MIAERRRSWPFMDLWRPIEDQTEAMGKSPYVDPNFLKSGVSKKIFARNFL